MSASEQYQTQREIARMNRARHGADDTLDRAEVRHNAIYDWVMATRFLAPVAVAMFLGAISLEPGPSWPASFGMVCVSITLARVVGTLASSMLGSFQPQLWIKTEHFVMQALGVPTAFIGFACGMIGLGLTGAALVLTPFIWKPWARRVLNNTDYERMRETFNVVAVPRIVE